VKKRPKNLPWKIRKLVFVVVQAFAIQLALELFSLLGRYTHEVVLIAENEGPQKGLIRSGRNRDQRAATHLGPFVSNGGCTKAARQ